MLEAHDPTAVALKMRINEDNADIPVLAGI